MPQKNKMKQSRIYLDFREHHESVATTTDSRFCEIGSLIKCLHKWYLHNKKLVLYENGVSEIFPQEKTRRSAMTRGRHRGSRMNIYFLYLYGFQVLSDTLCIYI